MKYPVGKNMKFSGVHAALQNSTSDKASDHNYGVAYNWIFNATALKYQRPLNILEIGISYFEGGSMKAFSGLPLCQCYVGIDREPYHGQIPDNARFYQVHNAYTDETIDLLTSIEPSVFDIIIDDGSHAPPDQEWFLRNYKRLLTSKGILIVEDITDRDFLSYLSKIDNDIFVIDGRYNSEEGNEVLLIKGSIY